MKLKNVYIAGKITGLPPAEVEAKFANAQKKYEAMGYNVINPYKSINDQGLQDWPYDAIMKLCIVMLMGCDAIILLHDWNESKGATIEYQVAGMVNMKILFDKEL